MAQFSYTSHATMHVYISCLRSNKLNLGQIIIIILMSYKSLLSKLLNSFAQITNINNQGEEDVHKRPIHTLSFLIVILTEVTFSVQFIKIKRFAIFKSCTFISFLLQLLYKDVLPPDEV